MDGDESNVCRIRITTSNPRAVQVKAVSSTAKPSSDKSCNCPDLIELNLKIKACHCSEKTKVENLIEENGKGICNCLAKSEKKQNFIKIDFVDGKLNPTDNLEDPKRNVLVLKLNELDVKCENGFRHELYFPNSNQSKPMYLSKGETVSISSPLKVKTQSPIKKSITNKCKKLERALSKSADDVKRNPDNSGLKEKASKSTQSVIDKEENSFSDMDSIELIIISDEFLHETQNQEVIIVNEEKLKKMSPMKSKNFQIKKNFLNGPTSKSNSKFEKDYFKRAAEAKAKSGGGGKRLVIISDEFKKKSLESTVQIVRSRDRKKPPKSKSISNAMVDLNSKIISCVLQSYEEPTSLENKTLDGQSKLTAKPPPTTTKSSPKK